MVPLVNLLCIYFSAKWENSNTELLTKYLKYYLKQNQEKDDFIANMSHDLRNPINAILGSLEFLEKEIKNKPQQLDLLQNA